MTAALMNEHFVNVKVDREERPDIDAVYMEATQAMTGSGGWPMTVFMTADGEPFYCGTYFGRTPRGGAPSFTQLMAAIHDAWTDRRDDLMEQAGRLVASVRRNPSAPDGTSLPGPEVLDEATMSMLAAHDATWGGFGTAPKFPQAMSLDHLLRDHLRTGSSQRRWTPWSCRSTRWPRVASTTTSAGGSRATRWTRSGWSRTSRRCSTTTPSWPGPTCMHGRSPATPAIWRSSARRSTTCWRSSRTPTAAATRRRTPTRSPTPARTTQWRARSTCGPRRRSPQPWRQPGWASTSQRCASGTASPTPATSRAPRSRTGCTPGVTGRVTRRSRRRDARPGRGPARPPASRGWTTRS